MVSKFHCNTNKIIKKNTATIHCMLIFSSLPYRTEGELRGPFHFAFPLFKTKFSYTVCAKQDHLAYRIIQHVAN